MNTTTTAAAPASPLSDPGRRHHLPHVPHVPHLPHMPHVPARTSPRRRSVPRRPSPWRYLEVLLLAGLAYIPLLSVDGGIVTSDTKTYLYLDPSRFLSQVWSMWNPTVGLGTVTHEYIGYLFPMGPFYAVLAGLHVPIWVAQRLWLGSILFAAGAGVLYLSRVLNLRAPGRTVAALAFMLSPYVLQYAGRISVILLPWAALPWLVAFAAHSLRHRGWRYPALFALTVATVGGINASSILYVGLAPALWLIYAAAVEREASVVRTLLTALKVGVLTILLSLWWIVGLQVEAAYGVDVLRFTETVMATSSTGNSAEVIRGLGYWYFYGADSFGPWTAASILYTQQTWLIGISYAVPTLGFIAAALTRWRHRAFFALLVVVGVVLSVGAFPFSHPTPFGGVLKAFMSDTTAGLAMRSTDRATPLVILGLAMLLGSGVSALFLRVRWAGLLTALTIAGVVIAANPAMFNGDAEVASGFVQPAKLPAYAMAAIHALNATHAGTRVLAIPGNDFASSRWGDTVDTPQPAFLTRPFVTREQQVMGSIGTANTLAATDLPIQTNIEDWTGLAPMARLMSAGDILVEYDQAFDHYGTPQPQSIASALAQTPKGLSNPISYGTPVPNISTIPTLDEQDLSSAATTSWPSPLETFTVSTPRPITRAESNTGAILVAGDATGLQDLANAGMLNSASAIYYSGSLAHDGGHLRSLASQGATLVLTDSNRKQAYRWDSLSGNGGFTETPTENPARTDPSDSPINLFPKTPVTTHSVAAFSGAVNVTASSYGNTVSYSPEDRAYNAVDGNLDTAWETGTFTADVSGQWWKVAYPQAVTTDHVVLTQPQQGTTSRWITKVTLSFDGGHPITTTLGPSSRQSGGQTIAFPEQSFRTLRITIDRTSSGTHSLADATAVGFSEVQVPGQHVIEVIAMPKDLLGPLGKSSSADRLVVSMARQRVSPYPPRTDPESTITREFTLPTSRTFGISGSASISGLIPDDEIDRLVGMSGTTGSGVVAYSKGRLPGDLSGGAAAAIDGDPATNWQPGFGTSGKGNQWLEYNMPSTFTFSHMRLQIAADGRHSVPTSFRITTENATQIVTGTQNITLPSIADSDVPGATTSVPVSFSPMTGRRIRITVTGVRLEHASNYYSTSTLALPLGIDNLGIPGLHAPKPPATVPGDCQSNLLKIDGAPIDVAVTGSTQTALHDGTLSVVPCGSDAGGITLGAGPHFVESALGHLPSTVDCPRTSSCTGWNVNSLVLDSAAGGGPEMATAPGQIPTTVPGSSPSVSVLSQSLDGERVSISGAQGPFELVLGQSLNAGWRAVVQPPVGASSRAHAVDLGAPGLVDAFANGWQITAADLAQLGIDGGSGGGGSGGAAPFATQPLTVTFTWVPQGSVNEALAISGVAAVICLVLGFLPDRMRRVLRSRRRHPSMRTALLVTAGSDGIGSGSPRLSFPGAWFGARPRILTALAAATFAGAIAGAVSYPLAGVAIAVAVFTGLLLGPARFITAMTAAALMTAATVRIVLEQLHEAPYPGPGWPVTHQSEGVLVWMAVVFLGADGVVEAGRNLAERRHAKKESLPEFMEANDVAASQPSDESGALPIPEEIASPGTAAEPKTADVDVKSTSESALQSVSKAETHSEVKAESQAKTDSEEDPEAIPVEDSHLDPVFMIEPISEAEPKAESESESELESEPDSESKNEIEDEDEGESTAD